MSRLTDEAKERYSLWMRFRFRFASWFLDFGFFLAPSEFYDEMNQYELKKMAEGLELEVHETEGDGDE